MKRPALIAFQIVLVALLAFGAAELWTARRSVDRTAAASTDTIAVNASVVPTVHTFGQPIVASVQVVADAKLVKPNTIRVETDFAPYEVVGKPTVERTIANGTAKIVFHYPLRCLAEGCDAVGDRGVAQFESGFVHYRFVQGSGPGRDLIDWPQIHVASRVTAAEVEAIDWRASRTPLPVLTTRFGPRGLATVLVALAIVLAAAATWLALRLWRVKPEVDVEIPDTRTPLERALDLVVSATANGGPTSERRRSLERLARELDLTGRGVLADHARELAWSSRPSSNDDVEVLVRRASDAAGLGSPE